MRTHARPPPHTHTLSAFFVMSTNPRFVLLLWRITITTQNRNFLVYICGSEISEIIHLLLSMMKDPNYQKAESQIMKNSTHSVEIHTMNVFSFRTQRLKYKWAGTSPTCDDLPVHSGECTHSCPARCAPVVKTHTHHLVRESFVRTLHACAWSNMQKHQHPFIIWRNLAFCLAGNILPYTGFKE